MSASAPETSRTASLVTPASNRRTTAPRARPRHQRTQAWVEALHSIGLRRDDAFVGCTRFFTGKLASRCGAERPLTHPSGRDLDDLAVQAADDAVVAILGKLHHFRGDSLFTTWARRFAQREAPAQIRRRVGRGRDLPMDLEFEHPESGPGAAPSDHMSVASRRSRSARWLA